MKQDENNKNVDKNWFSKHAETLTVIASLLGGFIWMDSKFATVDAKFDKVNERLSAVEKDIAVIRTVLSLKGINCNDMAARENHQEERNKGK